MCVQGKVRVLYVKNGLSIAGYLTWMPGCTAWQSGPAFLVCLRARKISAYGRNRFTQKLLAFLFFLKKYI